MFTAKNVRGGKRMGLLRITDIKEVRDATDKEKESQEAATSQDSKN